MIVVILYFIIRNERIKINQELKSIYNSDQMPFEETILDGSFKKKMEKEEKKF